MTFFEQVNERLEGIGSEICSPIWYIDILDGEGNPMGHREDMTFLIEKRCQVMSYNLSNLGIDHQIIKEN